MDDFFLGVFIAFLVFTPAGCAKGHSDGVDAARRWHAVEVSYPERAMIDGKENVSYQYDRAEWEPMGLIGDTLILKRRRK